VNILITILIGILKIVLPAVIERVEPRFREADPQIALRDKLRAKIKQTWPVMVMLMMLLVPGCGREAVYVPDGTPVRLRETVRNAKVWVVDKDKNVLAAEMDLPEGWYCLLAD